MERAVHLLDTAADLVLRALAVQAIWVLGTLAGGIVLGWAPATLAAVEAAARAERGERLGLRAAAATWRRCFWRAQVVLGLPGLLLLLGLASLTAVGAPLAVRAPAGIAALGLAVALLHIPDLELRYRIPVLQVLPRAFLLGIAQAPTSLVLGAVLLLWAGIITSLPGLIPFLGVSVPILAAHHLVSRSLDRNDDLLRASPPREHPGRSGPTTAPPPREPSLRPTPS